MGYSSVWKILDKMIKDLKKKGAKIPPNVINDLKSAQTLLQDSKTEAIDAESLQKIDRYLQNVEAKLVSDAQERFGDDYVDNWLKKLNEASREKTEETKEKMRFVPGVPRDEKWIRIQPSKDLPSHKLTELVEELRLSCTIQREGGLLVHGREEALRELVKRMTSIQKSRKD